MLYEVKVNLKRQREHGIYLKNNYNCKMNLNF